MGDAEARAARGVEERKNVLGGDEEQRDRAEADLGCPGEEVDELRLLADERADFVEDDEEVPGGLANPLLKDVEHLRERISPVGEGDSDGSEEVMEDGPVVRPSPAVHVDPLDGESAELAPLLQLAPEMVGDRGLAGPDPSGQQLVVRDPLAERLAIALPQEVELGVPVDELRGRVARIERFLGPENPTHGGPGAADACR